MVELRKNKNKIRNNLDGVVEFNREKKNGNYLIYVQSELQKKRKEEVLEGLTKRIEEKVMLKVKS